MRQKTIDGLTTGTFYSVFMDECLWDLRYQEMDWPGDTQGLEEIKQKVAVLRKQGFRAHPVKVTVEELPITETELGYSAEKVDEQTIERHYKLGNTTERVNTLLGKDGKVWFQWFDQWGVCDGFEVKGNSER